MAARKNLQHSEIVRQRIKTSQIVNRLTNHILRNTKMTSTQVAAGLGLLRKTIPDIESIEHLGQVQVKHSVVQDKPLTPEQWAAQYGPHSRAVSVE